MARNQHDAECTARHIKSAAIIESQQSAIVLNEIHPPVPGHNV